MSRLVLGRRGLTLVELMVALIVAGVVGAGLLKLMLGQARATSQQEAWRTARTAPRIGLNRLMSELRMVDPVGGVEAAVAGGQDFTLRVPYAMGAMCWSDGATSVVSLMPVDSATYAEGAYSGFAWRNSTGTYTYVPSATAPTSAGAASCAAASVTTVPAVGSSPTGQVVTLTGAVAPIPSIGTLYIMYRRIRYEFKASTMFPGRIGLWRTLLATGATEEVAAPFDAAARVRFYVLDATVPQAAVPASLGDIRGLELQLRGSSDGPPEGSSAAKVAAVTASVFFKNRPE
jgi:prepilin-type N-terminal cleavage/methylation domain-containing protein